MTLLRFLIVLFCFLRLKSRVVKINYFVLVIILELFFLVFCFQRNSWFFFFVCFELSVLPILVLILGWGRQPERLIAGSYMFLYTFFGSLPLLFKIIKLKNFFSNRFFLLNQYSFSSSIYSFWQIFPSLSSILGLFWLLRFIVKLPVFGFHSWLPKAHVEAPTIGSMLLAGVLLKLGLYGLLRLEFLLTNSLRWLFLFMFSFVAIGLVLLGFICFRQKDLKSMVAYSSIVHMRTCFLCWYQFKLDSFLGIVMLGISHGVVRRALFLRVGKIYQFRGRRSIMLKNSFLARNSILVLFLALFCSLKMSFPPFLSFIRELLMFKSILNFAFYYFIAIFMIIFVVGLYKMFFYTLISHGKKWLKLTSVNLNLELNLNLYIHLLIVTILYFYCSILW